MPVPCSNGRDEFLKHPQAVVTCLGAKNREEERSVMPRSTYTRDLPANRRNRFATTRWTWVQAAVAAGDSPASDEALARLCESYWYPLYAYLRRRGYDRDQAEDLTQAFFANLLDKRALRHADPARGRFRSFLLASLKNFVVNEWERETAQKRGGTTTLLSLDFQTAEGRFLREPVADSTPEREFDRAWSVTLLERVMRRLRAELMRSGKDARRAERLLTHLSPAEPRSSYAETSRELGLSEGAVKIAVHRIRARFRRLLSEEIAETVSTPADIDDEVRHLRSVVTK